MKQLAQALVKAQSKFEAAKKSASNPFHKSKYADLESVWEAVQGPLAEEGLAISQTFRHENDNIFLITHLIHTSGEMFTSEIPVIAMKKDPQGYGSAITYFRRYSLQAILCLVTSDDDGEGAHGRNKKDEPKEEAKPAQGKSQDELKAVKDVEEEKRTIWIHLKKTGWPIEALAKLSESLFGNTKDLSPENLKQLLEIAKKHHSLEDWLEAQ